MPWLRPSSLLMVNMTNDGWLPHPCFRTPCIRCVYLGVECGRHDVNMARVNRLIWARGSSIGSQTCGHKQFAPPSRQEFSSRYTTWILGRCVSRELLTLGKVVAKPYPHTRRTNYASGSQNHWYGCHRAQNSKRKNLSN